MTAFPSRANHPRSPAFGLVAAAALGVSCLVGLRAFAQPLGDVPEPPVGAAADEAPSWNEVLYKLDYRVEEGADVVASCPSAEEFVGLLDRRAARARIAARGESPAVTIALVLAPPRSTLTLAKGAGDREVRSIDVSDCWEAADAAALMVAVAVQSELTRNAGEPPALATDDSFTVPPVPPAQPAPEGFAPAIGTHPAPNPLPPRPRVVAEREERAAESRSRRPASTTGWPWSVRFGMGAVGHSSFGLAPNPLLGGSAIFTVEADQRGDDARLRWSPALHLLGGAKTSRDVKSPSGVRAAFSSVAAELDLCPLRGRFGLRVGFEPCVGVEFDRLSAEGSGDETARLVVATPQLRLWFSGDVGGGLRLLLAPAVGMPTSHDGFEYSPTDWRYRIPWVTWGISLGLDLVGRPPGGHP